MSEETTKPEEGAATRFGTNQIMAISAGAGPFVVACVALFLNRATFAEWSSFTTTLIPIVVGIALGVSGAIKSVAAFRNGAPK